MRSSLLVLMVILLVPTALNAGRGHDASAEPALSLMCHDRWFSIEEDARDGADADLRGFTFPNGVTVGSPSGLVTQASLKQATKAWNESLGVPIFRLARLGAKPDVTVSELAKVTKSDDAQGEIFPEQNEAGKVTARVLVGEFDGTRRLSDVEVGAVLVHELGHFLGLEDLPGRGGVMDEFDSKHLVLRPSAEETQAVLSVRQKALAALNGIR